MADNAVALLEEAEKEKEDLRAALEAEPRTAHLSAEQARRQADQVLKQLREAKHAFDQLQHACHHLRSKRGVALREIGEEAHRRSAAEARLGRSSMQLPSGKPRSARFGGCWPGEGGPLSVLAPWPPLSIILAHSNM